MKKITVMAFLLALLAPIMSAWGSSTWFAQLNVNKVTSSDATGSGKVYVGEGEPSASSTYNSAPTNSGKIKGTGGQSDTLHSFTFNLAAQADYKSKFGGWFKDEAANTLYSTNASATYLITCRTKDNEANPTTETVYAKFIPNPDEYTLTLNKPAGLKSYTITGPNGFPGAQYVNGGEPKVYNGEKYTITCMPDGYHLFQNKWNVDGTEKTGSSITLTISGNTSVTPVFVEKEKYTATCKSVAGGSYTAKTAFETKTISSSDASVVDYDTLSVTLTALEPNDGYEFYRWCITGSDGTTQYFSNTPYTTTKVKDNITISAEYISAEQTTEIDDYDGLVSALNDDGLIKVIIPGGKEIVVAKGATLSVPTGKQLVVDGTLWVEGTVANSGTISGNGTLRKISYLISQSDVITPLQANGSECGRIKAATAHEAMARYHKTTVTANSPTVTGAIGCKEGWGVALNGNAFYAISKQNPAALKVTIDDAKDASNAACRYSVNKIASIDGSVDDILENKYFVLLSDFTLKFGVENKDSSGNKRSSFRGMIDCANKTLTWNASDGRNRIAGSNSVFLNGVVKITPSSEYQNSQSTFFNCSEIQFQQVKGTSPEFAFYDCGTAATPTTVSFLSYNSNPTVVTHYFSGCYKYTFDTTYDNGHASVYGGSFTADPSNYIPASLKDDLEKPVAAVYDGSKYYVVQVVKPAEKVVSVGGVEYETLEEAVAKASNGATISLIGGVDLTGKTVTFPAGKTLTLNLDNHIITGGKVVVASNSILLISDISSANPSIVGCDIENNGTLDFVFGKYTGSIVNKAGTLTVHNGIFTGTVTKDGGTVNLKGGNFSNDISALAEVEGVEVFRDGSYYCPCEVPDGTMRDTTVSGASGYGIKPYSDSDYALMKSWVGGKTSRTDYSAADWQRLAELVCFYQVFNNNSIDPTLVFDRKVAADSLNLGTIPSSGSFAEIFFDVAPGKPYRALTETLMRYGPQMGYSGAAKTYSAIIKENISSVAVAVSDKAGENTGNAGTLCKTMIEIWEGQKVGSSRVTNTVFVVGQKVFTLGAGSNLAMIRPATGAATFYATLGGDTGIVNAVEDGGKILLSNDCSERLIFTKTGVYVFDTMGFAYTGETPTVVDGLVIKSAEAIDSEAKIIVPGAIATKYVIAVDPVVKVKISDEMKQEIGISPAATPEQVQELLKQEDTNKLPKWENFVLGQDGSKEVAIEAPTGGSEKTVEVGVSFTAPENTGYTVKYAFDKVDTNGDVVENGEGAAKDKPTLNIESVTAKDGPAYFKMRAVLEASDNSGVTAEVLVEKTIGVMKVESASEYTILAVPWVSLGTGDVKASELVHAASLQDGDQLIVYSDDGTTFNKWTVKEGEWGTSTKVVIDDNDESQESETPEPSSVGLARGKGVWLKRSKPEESPIYLIGQPSNEAVETPLAVADDTEGSSWNLVASPSAEPVNVVSLLDGNGSDADRVVVPTGANSAPKNFHYRVRKEVGAWGYDSTEYVLNDGTTATVLTTENEGKVLGVRAVFVTTGDGTKVPAGTGFWYLNSSKTEGKKISWGGTDNNQATE